MQVLIELAFFLAAIGISNACPDGHACYRYPAGCEPGMCDMTVTWMADDADGIAFSIRAKNNGTKARWAAVGFSSDQKMGEDDILMCRQTASLQVVLDHYWSQSEPRGIMRESAADPAEDGFSNVMKSSINGYFTCNFTRAVKVDGKDHIFDLSATSATPNYYFLFARGPVKSNTPRQHEQTPYHSSARVDYTLSGEVSGTDEISDDDDDGAARHMTGSMMLLVMMMMTCLAIINN